MQTTELVSRLVKLGVNLKADAGELKVKAPKGVLDVETAAQIRDRKAEIISILGELGAKRVKIPPTENRTYYPLSSSQKRLFFLNQLNPDTLAYNIFQVLKLNGKFDLDRVRKTFQQLVDRHSSLRTSLFMNEGEPVQQILANLDFDIPYHTLAEEQNPQEVIDQVIRPYDLNTAPLFRVAAIRVSEDEHQLIIDLHHIIADGTSLEILKQEFCQYYLGQSLKPLAIDYKDFAAWQQTNDYFTIEEKQKRFWLDQFSTIPDPIDLPMDHARPFQKSYKGDAVAFYLKGNELEALDETVDQFKTTKFVVLFAVFNVFLQRLTQQEDIVVGTFTSGRDREELESLIGMFVNTLPLRNFPKAESTFRSFLEQLKPNVIDCFDHQWYQFEKLVESLDIPKDQSRNPLFDVIFSFNSVDEKNLTLEDLKITQAHFEYENAKFDLKLSVQEFPGELICKFEYATDIFEKRTIAQFAEGFKAVYEMTLSDPQVKIGDIQLVSEEMQASILEQGLGAQRTYDAETVLTLFQNQVTESPNALAMVYGEQKVTYRNLNERSDQLAGYLLNNGIQRGSWVGIYLDHGPDLITATMAVLKTGGAFILIDPSSPEKRSLTIAHQAQLSNVIVSGSDKTKSPFAELDLRFIDLEDDQVWNSLEIILPNVSGKELAYALFTSGSTGIPKGAKITHEALANYLQWAGPGYLGDRSGDMALFTSVSFDLTLTSLFLPLVSGNCLHISESNIDASAVIDVVKQNRADVIKLTPSHLRLLLNAGVLSPNNSVHTFIVAGEVLDADLAQEVSHTMAHDIRIFNSYGPTEATVSCMLYQYDHELDQLKVPIGLPSPNNEIILLDQTQSLVPYGIPGEVHIGGNQLFKGYLNNEEQTQERLIEHPFRKGQKLYKTGDLAIRTADGKLEFRGRVDEQVKIRGYRIELEEIEHCLRQHVSINDAAVVVNAKQQIAIYYQASEAIETELLRTYLLERLPNYMVPSLYQPLDRMPLTGNGKVDKKALPEIQSQVVDHQSASGEIQEKLVTMWSELLGLEQGSISVNASFYDLGGNSINIISLARRINEEFGVEMPVASLFSLPTITRIHQFIEQGDVTKATADQELEESLEETNETLELLGLMN